jgi:TetR/AcrR family transcriptional repressor of mexJK operon
MALIEMLTQPCHLALDRAVSLEAQRNPDLGRRFFEAGPGQVRTMLTTLLRQAQDQGQVQIDDPECAAEDMLALWLGFDAIERRFCGSCIPDESVLRTHVARAVRLFLKANAPDH